MKKVLNNALAIFVAILLFSSCDTNRNRTDDTVESMPIPGTNDSTTAVQMTTDNPAMNTPIADMPKDSAAETAAEPAAKPNPAKKGKKGSVTVAAAETKIAGETDMKDGDGYYTNVYPSFAGGDRAISSFFEKNIDYPSDATENGVEGTVKISFTVDENGKIGAAKTINPPIGFGLEAEALRVFQKMPAWKPGSLKGKNVKTRYTLPVRFQLAD
jgi:TonB family protein